MDVYHNLHISPYKFEYGGMQFVFSSERKLMQFMKRAKAEVPQVNGSLRRRFKCRCDLGSVVLLRLYQDVERDNFLVRVEGEDIVCANCLRFDGRWVSETGSGRRSSPIIPPSPDSASGEIMLG